jgi:hypothetical protein
MRYSTGTDSVRSATLRQAEACEARRREKRAAPIKPDRDAPDVNRGHGSPPRRPTGARRGCGRAEPGDASGFAKNLPLWSIADRRRQFRQIFGLSSVPRSGVQDMNNLGLKYKGCSGLQTGCDKLIAVDLLYFQPGDRQGSTLDWVLSAPE